MTVQDRSDLLEAVRDLVRRQATLCGIERRIEVRAQDERAYLTGSWKARCARWT
jgi:hypothetical protein